jgi:hypothetical protein
MNLSLVFPMDTIVARHMSIILLFITKLFSGTRAWDDVLQFTLEWAITHPARPQHGEWKVLFAGNAFDLYTLEEVLKLSTVTVGADISTVAGATNGMVTRKREENGRPDRNLAFRTLKETCLQHALPPGRRSGIFGRDSRRCSTNSQ